MTNLFKALLISIASCSQKELVRQFNYLKVENEILRGKLPKRITVTPAERQRLVRAARKLGPMLKQLVTIVHPKSALRWLREDRKGYVPLRRGRRGKPIELLRLVIKLTQENNWGFDRILGELYKLRIRNISKSSIKRILREGGLNPSPDRKTDLWDAFLKRHIKSLWQCDLIHRRVVTWGGVRDAFVLVFIHVKTRQVVLSPATLHPNQDWVIRQRRTLFEPLGVVGSG